MVARSSLLQSAFPHLERSPLFQSSLCASARLLAVFALFGSWLLCSSPAANVLTYHNDNSRTGWNSSETELTPASVNPSDFGLLFIDSVDGKVDAQPLYVSGVTLPGQGVHNILYVATEHDSVYAFDADSSATCWHVSLIPSGETTSDARGCGQVTPEIGITSTPVIDLSSGPHGTIYVVAMSKSSGGVYHQRLHALDLTDGSEQFSGPVEIQATYPGNGPNSSSGHLVFDPAKYKERSALLLVNGVLYTSWASHCDSAPYSGWIISYDESTLSQVAVFNSNPNGAPVSIFLGDGSGSAFWNSGSGPAADAQGYLYNLTSNGPFGTPSAAGNFPTNGDYGDSFLKLSVTPAGMSVADYFTPSNQESEAMNDTDLGSGGVLLLPDLVDAGSVTRRLAAGAGKDGTLYLVDRDAMGKFHHTDQVYQKVAGGLTGGEWAAAAYFDGHLYYGPVGNNLLAYSITDARLSNTPSSKSPTRFGYPGTTPSVSSNGSQDGIVWAAENGASAVLHAYNASDLGNEIYNSKMAPNSRDSFGTGNKFITPTIANGKVYVGTTNGVGVFGLFQAEGIVAGDLTAYTAKTAPVTVDLLANASSLNGYTLILSSVTQAAFGTVMMHSDGSATYTPSGNTHPRDTFHYTLTDQHGGVATRSVTILNLYAASAGAYNGLATTASPTNENSGFFQVATTPTGAFSAILRTARKVFRFHGVMDAAGKLNVVLDPQEDKPLNVTLTVDPANQQAVGILTDGTFTANIVATKRTAAVPLKGACTALLDVDVPAAGIPLGEGFAVLHIGASGNLTFAGRAGDGTLLSSGAFLDQNRAFTTYMRLAATKGGTAGSLFGRVTMQVAAGQSDGSGQFHWFSPSNASPPFAADVTTIVSRYRFHPGTSVFGYGADQEKSEVQFRGNTFSVTDTVTLTVHNRIIAPDPNTDHLTLQIDTASGLFGGAFRGPNSTSRRPLHGTLFQAQSIGGGQFLDGTSTGSVKLFPH